MSHVSPRLQHHEGYQPVETRNLKRSPNCFFYVNGDKSKTPSRVCVNNRIKTFEGIMDELTRCLPRKYQAGGVRRIFTPTGGHRIDSLEQLVDGECYVAGLGTEKFVPLRYTEIPQRKPPYLFHNHKAYKKIDMSRPIKPVVHSKDQRLRDKSGRAYHLGENVKGVYVNLHVWDRYAQTPRRYNVNPHLPFAQIKKEIANHVHVDEERFDMYNFEYGGNTVTAVEQAEDFDKKYAVMVFEHRHKQGQHHLHGHSYWEDMIAKSLFKYTRSGRPNFHVYKNNNMVFGIPPDYRHGKSLNKYSVLSSIPSSKQSGGPISPYSNPPSQGGRKLNSNRSKPSKQVDYDEDHSGVYRAKGQDNARGAKQVNESRDTRTERPIDQMEAEEVEEEDFPSKEKTTPIPPGTELNKKPSTEQKHERESKKPNRSEVKKNSNKSNSKGSNKEKLVVSEIPPVVEEESYANSGKDGEEPIVGTTMAGGMESPIGHNQDDKATPNELKTNNPSASRPPMSTTPPESVKEKEKKEKINEDLTNHSNVDIENEQEHLPSEGGHIELEQEASNEGHRQDQWDDSFNQTDRTDRTDNHRNSTPTSARDNRRKDEEKEVKAATKLQAGARGWKARKEYQVKKAEKKQRDDARRQEEEMRQQGDMKKRQDEEKQKEVAASKIQAGFKGYQVRKDMRATQKVSENNRKIEKERNDAAVKIQSSFRGYVTRKNTHKKGQKQTVDINANKDNVDEEKNKREDEAATKIQSSFKGYKVRKSLKDEKEKRYEEEKAESAKKIQASFQGYKLRKDMAKQRQVKEQESAIDKGPKDAASVKIQASYRGYRTRKELDAKKKAKYNKQTEDEAATKIQAAARGYNTRKMQKQNKKEHQLPDSAPERRGNDDSELNTAATKIQSAFKGYQTRKEIKSQVTSDGFEMSDLLVDIDQLPEPAVSRFTHRKGQFNVEKQINLVTNIQNVFKADRSRKRLRKTNKNRLQDHSIDVLAAACRGHLTRKMARSTTYANPKHFHSSSAFSNTIGSQERTVRSQNTREYLQASVHGYFVRRNTHSLIEARSKVRNIDGADYFATLIQSLCKGYMIRHDLFDSKPTSAVSIQGPTSPKQVKQTPQSKSYWEDSNIKMYSDRTLRLAATQIQATYHMYKTRQNMCAWKLEHLIPSEQMPYESDEQANAAITIRNHFMSLAARKKSRMKEKLSQSMNEIERPKSSHSISSPVNPRKRKRESSEELKSVKREDDERSVSALSCSPRLCDSVNGMNADTTVSLIERKSPSKIVSPRSSLPSAKDKKGLEVAREGRDLSEIEDDEGELSSISKNVNAVSQLQAAFQAYRFRREISELVSGGGELIDITKIDRAVSALRKDFTLRSAKVRRLGFDKSRHLKKKWWDEDPKHIETTKHERLDVIQDAFRADRARQRDQREDDRKQGNVSFHYPRDGIDDSSYEKFHDKTSEKPIRVDDNYMRFIERQKVKEEKLKMKSVATIVAALSQFRKRKTEHKLKKEKQSSAMIVESMNAYKMRKNEFVKRKEKLKQENISTTRTAFQGHKQKRDEWMKTERQQSFETEALTIRNAVKAYEVRQRRANERTKTKQERAASLMIIKAKEEARRDEMKRAQDIHTIRSAFQNAITKKGERRERERRLKSRSSTRSLHVEMHSNILSARATELQAAFVGYQVRKVFLSLTRMAQLEINSSDKSHANSLERMGSLSETDDFKLKHKSLAKLHAFNKRNELEQAKNMHDVKRKSNSEITMQVRLPLIPYQGKSSNDMIRAKTGITIASVKRDDLGKKSLTQPVIFQNYHSTKSRSKIESYIKQKMAIAVIQSCCRGYFTRKGAAKKRKEKRLQTVKKNEIQPKSSKSRRVSFTPSQTASNSKKYEASVDNVNVNTSSVKLEAERRKLIAGTMKLRKETEEAKQGTTSLKIQAEKRKEENVAIQSNLERDSNSALCIQKTYRGYKVRKSLKESRLQKYENEYEEWKDKRINAAIAIQSSWRGYVVRKDIQDKEEKLMGESPTTLTENETPSTESPAELPELIIINIGRTKSEIERAEQRHDNASLVQMVVRASKMRRKVQIRLARRRLTNNVAASKIQALYKGFLTRRLVPLDASATRLQTVFKAHYAREKRYALLMEKERQRERRASSLQAAHFGRKKRIEMNIAKELKRNNEAATNIKSAFKGYAVREALCVEKSVQVAATATKMQACLKGRKERLNFSQKKKAASMIVSAYRSYICRCEMRLYKEKVEREETAATRLQACFRAQLCKKEYLKFREKMTRENKAASKLHGALRGRETRAAYLKYLNDQAEIKKKREASAVKIQSTYRGYKGRKIAFDRRNARQMGDDAKYIIDLILDNAFHYIEKRSDSADRIQATVAGHQSRNRVTNKLKVKAERQQRQRYSNASTVQAMFKTSRERCRVRKKRERYANASIVQTMFRTKQERKRLHRIKVIATKHAASSKIQANIRGRQTREYYRQRQIQAMKNTSASLIQTVVRAQQARNRLLAAHELRVQNQAATKIQALFRGFSVRLDVERERKIVSNLRPPVLSARTRSGRKLTIEVDDVLMRNAKAMILFHKKASELQAAFRAYLSRREIERRVVIKTHVNEKTPRNVISSVRPQIEDQSAILIQKIYRGYSDRKYYGKLIMEKRKSWFSASAKIQAAIQGYQVRREVSMRMKQMKGRDLRELVKQKNETADVISYAYRGFAYKKVCKSARYEM